MKAVDFIVFARRPRPGRVKRRLARSVGRRHATALYARTLAHTLAEVERLPGVRRILMPAAPCDLPWFRARLARRGWLVRPQAAGDLGRRMHCALAASLRQGRAAVLIGSDVMDLRAEDLWSARRHLATDTTLVLGPAADGGYWLIGLSTAAPELFAAMPWGRPEVFATTTATAARRGLDVGLLTLRHDLDHARDLFGPGAAAYRGRIGPRSRSVLWRPGQRRVVDSEPSPT